MSNIIALLFLSGTFVLFSAERTQTPPQPIARNNSWVSGLWSSGVSNSAVNPHNQTSSISPNSPVGMIINAAYSMGNNISSAVTTAKNAISIEAALIKIGWPLTDQLAQNELSITRNAYAQESTTQNEEKRIEFLQQIFRRTDYLHRIVLALPSQPERIAIAQFCIENHAMAMSPVLLKSFENFIKTTAGEALQAMGKNYAIQDPSSEQNNVKNILLKLGFNMQEQDKAKATEILNKCLTIYEIKKIFQKSENFELAQESSGRTQLLNEKNIMSLDEKDVAAQMIQDPSVYDKFIDARVINLRKIDITFLKELPCASSLLIVQHCLKHHDYLISPCSAGAYRTFIRQQESLIKQVYQNFGKTEIVPSANI